MGKAEVKEVQSAKLYVIEFPMRFRNDEQFAAMKAALAPYEKEFNCKFLILEGGAKFCNPEAPVINISGCTFSE